MTPQRSIGIPVYKIPKDWEDRRHKTKGKNRCLFITFVCSECVVFWLVLGGVVLFRGFRTTTTRTKNQSKLEQF